NLQGVEVKKIEKADGGFRVVLTKGEPLLGKTVIVASGKRPRMLGVPGENKFRNKGVMICATCDGPMFADKQVAVVGGGNSALDAALQMIRIASKVYLVNVNKELTGDAVMIEKLKSAANLEILNSTKTLEIVGDKFVKALKVEQGGKSRELSVEGVFVEIGLIPNSQVIDFVDKNELGEIEINCAAETSCPGVFAAGDVASVPEKQIIIAAGDGAKACLSAFRYLSRH
ncbi:MAG: FAD-dependent oxidoreductase, partial [Candidatus Margulisiibacteriota bacterium]